MSFTVCNDGARPLSFFSEIPTQVAFDGTRHTVGGCVV
jgi:hypothetical protein